MLLLFLLTASMAVCRSAPINCDLPNIVTPLNDLIVSVGSEVLFECRLDVSVGDEYLNGLVTWSINGKIEKSNVKQDGRLVIEEVPSVMNNSVIQCSFFSCLSSSAVITLIGQPDTPVLSIASASSTSVTINISPGNTGGAPISKIRISLPLRVYSYEITPAQWSDFTHEIEGLSYDSDVLVSVQCWNGFKWSDAGSFLVNSLSPLDVIGDENPSSPPATTSTITTATPSSGAIRFKANLLLLFLVILVLF